ncbi:hypothetical protein IJG28_02230 [Candidatus Saccharibacteria bacterium]|nr:hypothetical protein [Candidatus Saccharibacteria bacterium]
MKKIVIYLGAVLMVGVMGSSWLTKVRAAEINVTIPDLYIRAVNPGYKINGINNVGEMIEIARSGGSDVPISLAGIAVGYTNSSGNYSTLLEFPENSFLTGETIILRLASSPSSELAAVNYSKTLAMKAGIDLRRGDEVVDAVCWTSKSDCYSEFKSTSPTTLVRNLETGEFEHVSDYEPRYEADSYYVEQTKEEEGYGIQARQCKGLEFSEILSYYETVQTEQFIELHNTTAEQMKIDGCAIRYKNKNYKLTGLIKADGYMVYFPRDFRLTKNPKNGNLLELIDTDGQKIDSLTYPNGQRKGTAYALIGYDEKGKKIWRTTYAPTPGEPNNYQEFKTCEAGKVINEATGNCVKVTEAKTKICKEGQYLNILTGRCRKIPTTKEKTCKEGYYLNSETNRCRKIKDNTGADYSLVPESYEEKSSFAALYAVLGVVAVGLGYLVYEFRHEIGRLWRKVCQRFR